MDFAVSVIKLTKRFAGRVVLDQVSLQLAPGAAVGLVGLNGAGKTTFIRLLLGLLKPDSPGAVSVLGFDPWRHCATLCRRLGVVLENDGFEGNLDFRTNLYFYGAAKGMNQPEIAAYLNEFWAGAAIASERKPVKFFSRGQRMQCALCRAFLGWPPVVLLDEPTVALDIEGYDHFCRLTREAVRRGAAVLISSHVLETIDELCDSVAVLHERKIEVRSLSRGDSNDGEMWAIGANDDPRYQTLIAASGGTALAYEHEAGEWRFRVGASDTVIPLLIRRLTEAGLTIRYVEKKRPNLRELLRRGGAPASNAE